MNDNLQLIILRGLPACGKTTWCRDFLKEYNFDNTWMRVSTEDLRGMLNFGTLSSDYEFIMKALCINTIMTGLLNGFNIVYDADNLNLEHTEELIKTVGIFHENESIKDVAIVYKDFFDVSVEECIKRDAQRVHSVGADVIHQLNTHYKSILKNLHSDMPKH